MTCRLAIFDLDGTLVDSRGARLKLSRLLILDTADGIAVLEDIAVGKPALAGLVPGLLLGAEGTADLLFTGK